MKKKGTERAKPYNLIPGERKKKESQPPFRRPGQAGGKERVPKVILSEIQKKGKNGLKPVQPALIP